MKSNIILLIVFSYVFNTSSQSSKYIVVEDSSNNIFMRINNDSKNIAIFNSSLDVLDKRNLFERERIQYIFENTQFLPNHYEELNSGKYWISWIKKNQNNLRIHSTIFDPVTGNTELIDSIQIPVLNYSYSWSTIKSDGFNKIFLITIYNGISGKEYLIIKYTDSGKIRRVIKIDSSSGNTFNKLKGLHIIRDFVILSPNKYLVTGQSSSVVSILDSNGTNIFTRPLYLPWPIVFNSVRPYKPSLHMINSNSVLVSDDWPYTIPNLPENILYKLKVNGDSVYMDNLFVISNKEKLEKSDTKIASIDNQTFYIAANVDYQVPLTSSFPSSFFITKWRDDQEVWHKEYKSDYYFHVMDLQMIDSCTLIVCGSVFDYFNNGYLQGFYALIDCDGNVINSNIDLINSDIEIYPNPASDYTTIKHHFPDHIDADLVNINGQVVAEYKQICQDEPYVIHVGNMVRGIYILRLKSNDKKSISSKRIILE